MAHPSHRPLVTLAFAQSLDGCIAARPGERTALSGPESLAYTHRLRAKHDAILIGIGTVLADNPRLTVRFADGANPQPIVLDSHLRMPLDAALLRHPTHRPWVFVTPDAEPGRRAALARAGAELHSVPRDARDRLDLEAVLNTLCGLGIRRLMVEGGARVLTAFLHQGLADRLSVTIAPRWLGGQPALSERLALAPLDPVWHARGDDMVLEARLSERETDDD